MLPQNASLEISLFTFFLPGHCDVTTTQMDPLVHLGRCYVRGAVMLRLPHTHTLNLFSAAAPGISQPETAGRGEAVSPHTQTHSQAAGVCVCSGWFRAFSSVCHHWCHFLVANAIVTHKH